MPRNKSTLVKPASESIAPAGPRRADRAKSVVRIPKAAEIVSKELRNQIVRGTLKEGESLAAESELMTRFGISRPTLREALRILESEGLISVSRGAHGGATVCNPTIDVAAKHVSIVLQTNAITLADISRLHMVVEPPAARIVAENFSKSAPLIMRQRIEDCRRHFDDNYGYGLATARFRNTLIELADVRTLTLLMGMLNNIFERHWGIVTATAGQQLDNAPDKKRGIRSLEKLVEYIAAGDGLGAEEHWRNHTAAVEKMMRKWLPAATVIDILD